jgi:DNA-binding NarL/FixJ family response regulator
MTSDEPERLRLAVAGPQELVERLRRELAGADVDIVAAGSTRDDAIRHVRAGAADVCVVDRNLDGGGLITAAAIASPRRPAVIVVGADTPAEQRAVRLAGAAASLPHDSTPTELMAVVLELARKEQR